MFIANPNRYEKMIFRRAGNSGIKLPIVSFGLWNNFSENDDYEKCRTIVYEAFNNGITHFDLANNYGPKAGNAEIYFGRILKDGLGKYRDELFISTKAGYHMWDGPYGNLGSRKYLISSLDQSLERMGLKYVDLFYHHREDTDTDIRETMIALRDIVLQGKALYVGLSNYHDDKLIEAVTILKELNVPYVLYQAKYNMFVRDLEEYKSYKNEFYGGFIAYSILAQGILSNRYQNGIPEDSRISLKRTSLKETALDENYYKLIEGLDIISKKRNESIACLVTNWCLRNPNMTSVLISCSKIEQLYDNLKILESLPLTETEIKEIEDLLNIYKRNKK
ncbi:MAG: aldo/keto reductase [Acholeplasmatales bacterium]|jgi:L-glyceraldehyde 3-phosphate reductase|nr:aldo/keto reductase [Acholeplasmatales bacterium]